MGDCQRQVGDRLKNWKRSNKIITHIRENPFNSHMDCLERLNHGTRSCDTSQVSANDSGLGGGGDGGSVDDDNNNVLQGETEELTEGLKEVDGLENPGNNSNKQQQQLQNYASHLTHLYKKNQALMDNNHDFRCLLYNIICCLLIQDEQVLSSPSVTKMIDVIRSHLESTSKFYEAISLNSNPQQTPQIVLPPNQLEHPPPATKTIPLSLGDTRKGSLGSLSQTSSTGSSFNQLMGNQSNLNQKFNYNPKPSPPFNLGPDPNHLHPNELVRRSKPADFRRISSISYNDEQLINDLCEGVHLTGGGESSSNLSVGGREQEESPWRFDELSREYRHNSTTSNHNTSQSSLDNTSTTLELMNDSGISGSALYDLQIDDFLSKSNCSSSRSTRKRLSDVSGEHFKPQQQPSYISTDDYLSQIPGDESMVNKSSALYDDDSSSMQQRRESLCEHRPVDVASRRAELEWTLNKLINFELKYTWLSSKDTLRKAIRKIGVPNEIRGKVWLLLIDKLIDDKYDAVKLLEEASKTIGPEEEVANSWSALDDETQSILKQIDLDVNRTMPGHKLFDDGAEGGIKLRRILVAYSIHVNRAIAYCQGFNFIVALLLSVFDGDEEKALRGFVCIVDHIFPSKFYFDHYLTGARADQFLLADFICDQLIKNPSTAERKMIEGVTSSITLNWFISLFHGAVPTLTRLTILDHFMLEGVKALFRFTMAILYLAFQVTPPSSCEVFATIRNTARDMYDIKLLLSIVGQIKLPKDSYFAIRRSFYMVQSSFNSDQFYMQSLSNDASRQLVSTKPLSVQQMPDTKPPAVSLITSSSLTAHQNFAGSSNNHPNASSLSNKGSSGPRVCMSLDRTKVCIQNIGKLGRSHIKVMDANVRSNERSLMSPLRNCLVVGISNCGKNVIIARQSSKRNYKTFREQDLMFHVHELCADIFDGFYLEDCQMVLITTHSGDIYKIDLTKCFADSQVGSTETLMLKESHSIGEHDKLKVRLVSMDVLTNLLWIYVECEDNSSKQYYLKKKSLEGTEETNISKSPRAHRRSNNPFLSDNEDLIPHNMDSTRGNYRRKIIIIDIITFDIFSAFALHHNFGDIINIRTSLVAFCQISNPMSNQFSSRIMRIGPTGRYEHLLSFSDVVDFLISIPDSCKRQHKDLNVKKDDKSQSASQRYSRIKRLLPRSISLNYNDDEGVSQNQLNLSATDDSKGVASSTGTLTRYYRSLMRRHSTASEDSGKADHCLTNTKSCGQTFKSDALEKVDESGGQCDDKSTTKSTIKDPKEKASRPLVTSYLSDVEEDAGSSYIPVNMVFIFRNGKIALFEFTESYAIHTRESQLERYDYSKVVEVAKSGEDFIITILTIFDKLIKVVI